MFFHGLFFYNFILTKNSSRFFSEILSRILIKEISFEIAPAVPLEISYGIHSGFFRDLMLIFLEVLSTEALKKIAPKTTAEILGGTPVGNLKAISGEFSNRIPRRTSGDPSVSS